MIILLTSSDVKGESVGTAVGEMTENDFYMSLGGWVYLVAYIQGEQAMIFRHGNSNERKLVSVSKLWQLISRATDMCKEYDCEAPEKLSPESDGWTRRRYGLKLPKAFSFLEDK